MQFQPQGTVYTSLPSGWFDLYIFGEWFKKVFLPHVRRLPGSKVLIGDNLSSHISLEVIQICREEHIQFICLPPNSTDKMQPLGKYLGTYLPTLLGSYLTSTYLLT